MQMVPLDKLPMYYNQIFMYELVMGGNEIARLNALDLATKYFDARICEYVFPAQIHRPPFPG